MTTATVELRIEVTQDMSFTSQPTIEIDVPESEPIRIPEPAEPEREPVPA